MKKTLVSIAVVTYNRRKYLRMALEAALSQTFTNFELLIVDNASNDGTAEMVSEYRDPRLLYIRRSVNGGPAANYIEAMTRAKGDFLLISHDDDVMHPELVERQLEAFSRHPDAVLVAANVSLIDFQGTVLQDALYSFQTDLFFPRGAFLKSALDEGFWLPAPTFMLRHHFEGKHFDLWKTFAHGEKDAKNLFGITGDMWSACRMNGVGSIVFLATPLLAYRQHQEQHNFNDDQVSPQVPFYGCILKHLCRKHEVFRPFTQEVAACLLRYQMQELILCKIKSLNQAHLVLKQLGSLENRFIQKQYGSINIDHFTQFALVMLLIGGSSSLIPVTPESWMEESATSHLSAFRRWYASLSLNSRPLSFPLKRAGVNKVVILGSLLNALTIALDCSLSGIEVACFFDSNRRRAGRTLAGVTIIPIEQASSVMQDADCLIFSSERRTESSLKNYIAQYLCPTEINKCVSWMSLAAVLPKE